jgi:predicted dehydrogenase
LEKRGILRVTSLVDPVQAHVDSLGSFFPSGRKYRELEEALATSGADLSLVLSPAHLHHEHVMTALRHKTHVLCEKPMANSSGDCAAMNTVALETNRVLAIGMIRRYFPAFTQLKRVLDDGQLGSLISFEYREGHKFEWEVTTPAAFRPRNAGGTGVLFDIGPHVIDHLAWTFSDLRVTRYRDDALAGIESNAFMDVESRMCPGSIHLSWDNLQTNELRVRGSKGEAVLRIDRFDQLAVRTSSGFEPQEITASFPSDVQTSPRLMSPRSYPQAIYCQLVQVARAIQLAEAPAVDGECGQRTVAVLESSLALAAPLQMPWLDAAELERFQQLHWTNAR